MKSTEAQIDALNQQRRLLRERINQELQSIIITLDTAGDVYELTQQETEQADILRRAEVERFRGGASDFFLVNLREQTAANAKVRLAQAEFALAAAHIAYQAATLDDTGMLNFR